jgi:hypothetical protein
MLQKQYLMAVNCICVLSKNGTDKPCAFNDMFYAFYDSIHPTIFEEICASEIFQLYKRHRI